MIGRRRRTIAISTQRQVHETGEREFEVAGCAIRLPCESPHGRMAIKESNQDMTRPDPLLFSGVLSTCSVSSLRWRETALRPRKR